MTNTATEATLYYEDDEMGGHAVLCRACDQFMEYPQAVCGCSFVCEACGYSSSRRAPLEGSQMIDGARFCAKCVRELEEEVSQS